MTGKVALSVNGTLSIDCTFFYILEISRFIEIINICWDYVCLKLAADFPVTGRGIRATRDIAAGERILELAECFLFTGSEQEIFGGIIAHSSP